MKSVVDGVGFKKSFPALDWLRALAAISVFAHHFFQQYKNSFHDESFARFMSYLGAWGVAVFFVLSGFCIHWSRISSPQPYKKFDIVDYGIRRFFRIYPAFLFCTLLCFLVGKFYTSSLIQDSEALSVLAHLTLVSSFFVDHRSAVNGVLWSVVVECHFYILYGVLWHRFSSLKGVGEMSVAAVLVSFIAFASSVVLFPSGHHRVMLQSMFLATWWSWCLGAIVAEFVSRSKYMDHSTSLSRVLYVTFFVLSLLLAFLPSPIDLMARRFVLPVFAALFLYFLLKESFDFGRAKSIVDLGLISYSIYLFHPLAILVVHQMGLDVVVAGVVVFPLGYLMAKLMYAWIERPFVNIGRNILLRRNI